MTPQICVDDNLTDQLAENAKQEVIKWTLDHDIQALLNACDILGILVNWPLSHFPLIFLL